MIRATIISVIDQALLSALNFGIASALIYFASKQDYGLYAQLINLQSLFSPVHAGIFVSAFLAIGSRKGAIEYETYRSNMTWAELGMTLVSAVAVAVLTFVGLRIANTAVSWSAAAASAAALLGLWWREFARQQHFARMRYASVLHIDTGYVALIVIALTIVLLLNKPSVTIVLWCLFAAGAIAASSSFFSALRTSPSTKHITRDVAESWRIGKWDAMGSMATWGYAQSYLYLAAIQGGLGLVAEVSAARLLATPLPLLWASYANVLRPTASKLFAQNKLLAVRHLAVKAVGVVLTIAACYSLTLPLLLPFVESLLEKKGFTHIYPLAFAWAAYFAVTGVSTVAASILRSALAFREVFVFQVIACVVALFALAISFRFATQISLIVALTFVEAFSAVLLWRHLWQTTRHRSKPALEAVSAGIALL